MELGLRLQAGRSAQGPHQPEPALPAGARTRRGHRLPHRAVAQGDQGPQVLPGVREERASRFQCRLHPRHRDPAQPVRFQLRLVRRSAHRHVVRGWRRGQLFLQHHRGSGQAER